MAIPDYKTALAKVAEGRDPFVPVMRYVLTADWQRPLLSDYMAMTLTAGDVCVHIARTHLLLKAAGVKPGDKVALCAKNSANWAATFMALRSYGAVVVLLLHEFHPDTIENLVNHSDTLVLFTEKSIFANLDPAKMPQLQGIVLLGDASVVLARVDNLKTFDADKAMAEAFPHGVTAQTLPAFVDQSLDDLAIINYTSGSTGSPKGVMLPCRAMWANTIFALRKLGWLHPGDTMLSMLPLAHMYGLAFELLYPMLRGCHIYFLGRTPSPRILLDAFQLVAPKLVITVPLVIEKIMKTRVFPALKQQPAKTLLAVPGLRQIVYRKVKQQLLNAFGGNLRELVIGGAALSEDVEEFLRKIHFPFTVGYGMTECAPLLTYDDWDEQRPRSVGRMVTDMEARVASADPEHTPGVLSVKGPNVMCGYFKNPQATAEALSKDGWLNTGDIATIDKDGYVYLRGRDKNMILGPSGQNIYPEEIEAKLNELPLVGESVVVDRDGRIVAIVHPDYDLAEKQGLTREQTDEAVKSLLPTLNKQLPGYSRVAEIEIRPEEFAKTPKHSIRRYLYK